MTPSILPRCSFRTEDRKEPNVIHVIHKIHHMLNTATRFDFCHHRSLQNAARRCTAPLWLNLLKPTGHVMHQEFNIQQLYVLPTLCWCFLFIWEQTTTCATYSINWLVFITEMKSVYCGVRTGSLTKAVCASYLKG